MVDWDNTDTSPKASSSTKNTLHLGQQIVFGLESGIGPVPAEEVNAASHTPNHYPASMAPPTSLSQQIPKAICHSTQIETQFDRPVGLLEPPREGLNSDGVNACKRKMSKTHSSLTSLDRLRKRKLLSVLRIVAGIRQKIRLCSTEQWHASLAMGLKSQPDLVRAYDNSTVLSYSAFQPISKSVLRLKHFL